MHRYDLVFYARLIDNLSYLTKIYNFTLIVTDHLYKINYTEKFIHKKFNKVLIVPVHILSSAKIMTKIKFIFKLRNWHTKNINPNDLLILTDKSNIFSRFFLRRSYNVLLIQQLEDITTDYNFDIPFFIKDTIKSIIIGSCFAKQYIHKSTADNRGLKLLNYGKKKLFLKIYNVPSSQDASHFELPPLSERTEKKIVIFGSRFFSWDINKNSKDLKSMVNKLTKIYSYIYSNFQNYEYFYIPHPFEKGKEYDFINNIFFGKLKKAENFFSSEHFLYENRDIEYTFSIASTSSFSSYSMGYSSKVFYKMLKLPDSVKRTISDIFFGLSDNFFAQNYTDLIQKEVSENSNKEFFKKFSYYLNKYDV